MQILKVISLLLDYPQAAVQAAREELAAAINGAREISPEQRQALHTLLAQVCDQSLLDAQEAWGELFERGRYLSLLLFEHVHGESRDRGQAMVDLMGQYEAAGFAIGVKELPDYIPLYLEYLATRDPLEAREGLADVEHLLTLLAARLQERESAYAACFTAMLQLIGADPQQAVLAVEPGEEDTSLEALDQEWEEEEVTFLNGDSGGDCPSNRPQVPTQAKETVAVPLHWTGFNDQPATANKV